MGSTTHSCKKAPSNSGVSPTSARSIIPRRDHSWSMRRLTGRSSSTTRLGAVLPKACCWWIRPWRRLNFWNSPRRPAGGAQKVAQESGCTWIVPCRCSHPMALTLSLVSTWLPLGGRMERWMWDSWWIPDMASSVSPRWRSAVNLDIISTPSSVSTRWATRKPWRVRSDLVARALCQIGPLAAISSKPSLRWGACRAFRWCKTRSSSWTTNGSMLVEAVMLQNIWSWLMMAWWRMLEPLWRPAIRKKRKLLGKCVPSIWARASRIPLARDGTPLPIASSTSALVAAKLRLSWRRRLWRKGTTEEEDLRSNKRIESSCVWIWFLKFSLRVDGARFAAKLMNLGGVSENMMFVYML